MRGRWLAALVIVLGLAAGTAVGDDEVLDARSRNLVARVRAAYAGVSSLEALFDQTNEWELVEPRTPYRGRLYVEASGRLRLEYVEPQGHLLVADGEWVWTYVPESAQVVKSPAGAQGAIVARLFLDFLGGQRVQEVRWDGGDPEIVLDPDESLGLDELRVAVDGRSGIGRRFTWTDLEGNTSEYEIRESKLNVPLAEELFHFHPPEGVDVLELEG